MALDEKERVERYASIITQLLEAVARPDVDKAVSAILEENREYLDGRFFNVLAGFGEEAALNEKFEIAETIKQLIGIARSYRASLTLQKLPPSAKIIEYDEVVAALVNAPDKKTIEAALQEYQSRLNEELVAILLFRAMQARQIGRTELIQPLVELADLVLMYMDAKQK